MNRAARFSLIAVIIALSTVCDQAVKNFAQATWAGSLPVSIWNDLIRIEYIENPGAILGLGGSLPAWVRLLLMFVFTGLTLFATLTFAYRPPHNLRAVQLAGLSFIAAGGLGNLLDRIFNQGRVVDFVSFGIGPLRTGIMNLADIAIFIGAVMFFLFYHKDQPAESPTPE